MITEVSIKNLAMVRDVEFELSPDLNVFTGETGAGKSLVVSAVAFAFGQRSGVVKMAEDAEAASVTVTLDVSGKPEVAKILDEAGIESDGEVIITRSVGRDGKTKSHVNGSKAAVSTLQRIGRLMVEISGQNEELILQDRSAQLALFDSYCGDEMVTLKASMAERHGELKKLVAERERMEKSEGERARELDLYSFQAAEIRDAGLRENEDDEIAERLTFLKNAENIARLREELLDILSGGEGRGASFQVVDGLSRAASLLAKLASYDPTFEKTVDCVNDAYYALRDVESSVDSLADRLDYSESELNEKMERQHLIGTLKRKYGATLADVMKYMEDAEKKVEMLSNFERSCADIGSRIDKSFAEFSAVAAKVGRLRAKRKGDVEAAINAELAALDMKNADFRVAFHQNEAPTPENSSADGFETLEFTIRTNPGMPHSSLAQTASGGEMSRVMLAVKNVLSTFSRVPTIIFDEVDTGIGGFTLNAIGEKLRSISRSKQVVCITHSPIIASFAASHLKVVKEVVDGEKTLISIKKLDGRHVEDEIARMLGNDSEIGVSHARELIRKNKSDAE